MKTGFVTTEYKIRERTRLSEFSLLLTTLGIEATEYYFVSLEAHGNYFSDIETIRTLTSRVSKRDERVVFANLPSFKNYFPQTYFVEQMEESDHDPGIMEDRYLEFWSAFDTLTYRHWISFYILRLKMLFCIEDNETELLFWERTGGDLPTVGREDRRYLLLLRFFSPFFRGRKVLYEKVLPAFLKKEVTVDENIPSTASIPVEYRIALGQTNSMLGRDFYPGSEFEENFTAFRVNVNGLEAEDINEFAPVGPRRALMKNLLILFASADAKNEIRFNFQPGLEMFTLGEEARSAHLGFSTYLRQTL